MCSDCSAILYWNCLIARINCVIRSHPASGLAAHDTRRRNYRRSVSLAPRFRRHAVHTSRPAGKRGRGRPWPPRERGDHGPSAFDGAADDSYRAPRVTAHSLSRHSPALRPPSKRYSRCPVPRAPPAVGRCSPDPARRSPARDPSRAPVRSSCPPSR